MRSKKLRKKAIANRMKRSLNRKTMASHKSRNPSVVTGRTTSSLKPSCKPCLKNKKLLRNKNQSHSNNNLDKMPSKQAIKMFPRRKDKWLRKCKMKKTSQVILMMRKKEVNGWLQTTSSSISVEVKQHQSRRRKVLMVQRAFRWLPAITQCRMLLSRWASSSSLSTAERSLESRDSNFYAEHAKSST